MSRALLTVLRSKTSEAHGRLDAALALGPDVDRERYVAFLRGSLAAVSCVEPGLTSWFGDDERLRSAALRADLVQLEQEPNVPDVEPRALLTLAAALGCRYVVEGSALGGVVIAKMVEQALPHAPTRYLRLRGDDTGAAWAGFLGLLERSERELAPGDVEIACDTAVATFALYERAFLAAGAISS